MAVADTYNGDLVRIKQKCPEAGGDFDTELTEAQEQAYAYINMRIAAFGETPPVTADNLLKTIEAMIGAGLFKESQIFPADDKEFPKKSEMRRTGEKWLEMWLDNKYGAKGDESEDFVVHQKYIRRPHIAASKDDEIGTVYDNG